MRKQHSIDIIIPIYNAFDELEICLESIYKNTNLEKNRLILINDNSPDERIKSFLDKQCGTNIIVIHNETNKGFSNNINIGMDQSEDNDVILLNSDTIVTKNWVEKLSACAYKDETIGTVTPLSNNASLCSVPDFCEENILPAGMNVEQAGQIVEHCSLQNYPRITVAHGFCMYVKREVIDEIGNFDAETFERGYGEENDFCNRATLAGYHHVMCDDTYIYHSGTKSFVSKEKQKYIQAHDEILRKRYPEQMKANDVHVRDNPNHTIGENIDLFFKVNNGKQNILYIVHSDFRQDSENHLGGTQLHVKDLTFGLRNQYNMFVAARNGAYLNLTVYLENEEIRFRYYIGEVNPIYEFHNDIQNLIWRNIINAFQINLIHVHHTYGLSFDIFYVAKELNIPIIFTAHDYYFICPTIKMFNYQDKVCIGNKELQNCSVCLKELQQIATQVDYIKIWRKHCQEVLEICKKIIVPEESIKDIWKMYYPQFVDKLISIEHGYDANNNRSNENLKKVSENLKFKIERIEPEGSTYRIIGWTLLNKRKKESVSVYLEIANEKKDLVPTELRKRIDLETKFDGDGVGFIGVIPQDLLNNHELKIKVVILTSNEMVYSNTEYCTEKLKNKGKNALNVAFIGGISKEKGGKEIAKIIKSMDKDVNWYVFGGIGEKSLQSLQQKNLIKTGFYNPEDLPLLLSAHRIDVIAILSLWPETYSYTLTEAIINKIPTITTNIGALGSRTDKLKCGWAIPCDTIVDSFIKIIKEINEDKSVLLKLKKQCEVIPVKNIENMAQEYLNLYKMIILDSYAFSKADNAFIFNGYCNNNYDADNMNSDIAKEISDLKRELEGIHKSVAYQYAYKLSMKNFPGRKKIREILLKLSHQ